MGLMMISVGICAAFWEDKLRSTPGIVRRGYYVDRYQYIFGELTHPRPGAAAAAAVGNKSSLSFLYGFQSLDLRHTRRNSFPHRSLYPTDVRNQYCSYSYVLQRTGHNSEKRSKRTDHPH